MNLVDGGRLRVIACHPISDAVDHILDLRNEYFDGPQSRNNEPDTVVIGVSPELLRFVRYYDLV